MPGKRILVVDDDSDFSRMITRLLSSRGYDSLCAHTTEMARAACQDAPFDAVLLDLVLGRESGWETLRALKSLSRAPILLMTGGAVDGEMRLDAEVLGA